MPFFTSSFAISSIFSIAPCPKNTLVFVEVKTRTNQKFGRPCEAVDGKKQEKYRRICEYYFIQNKIDDQIVSFAVIEILKNQINFIKNAF